jgi:hypothetical protein
VVAAATAATHAAAACAHVLQSAVAAATAQDTRSPHVAAAAERERKQAGRSRQASGFDGWQQGARADGRDAVTVSVQQRGWLVQTATQTKATTKPSCSLLAVAEARQRAGSVSTRGTAAAAETTTAILVVAVGGGKTREVEGITVGGASSKQSGMGSRTEESGSERERRGSGCERQLVVRLFNGAVDGREAQGTRAQDQVQESEKERPDDSLREPDVRHALAVQTQVGRSRAAGHPRPAATAATGRRPRCGRRVGVTPLVRGN